MVGGINYIWAIPFKMFSTLGGIYLDFAFQGALQRLKEGIDHQVILL